MRFVVSSLFFFFFFFVIMTLYTFIVHRQETKREKRKEKKRKRERERERERKNSCIISDNTLIHSISGARTRFIYYIFLF